MLILIIPVPIFRKIITKNILKVAPKGNDWKKLCSRLISHDYF